MKTFDEKWGSRILIATVVCICLYFFPSAMAAEDPDTDIEAAESISTEFFKEVGFTDNNPDWGDVFKNGKKNGQDLYALAYYQVKKAPTDTALANTADYFGYTDDRLNKILEEEDVNSILYFDKSVSEFDWDAADLVSLTSRVELYLGIVSHYENELLIEKARSEFESIALAQEIFVNGDTSDSGFDLINDLQIIEIILFYRGNDAGYGSGGFDFGDGGEGGGDIGDFDFELDEDDDEVPTEEEPEEEEDEEEESEEEEGVFGNKNECFEDSELEEALDGFLAEYERVDVSGDIDSGDDDEGSGGGSGSGDDDDGGGSGSGLEAPEAADWSRSMPCDDFFCLEVNFVSGDDEDIDYEETYNCVDCHFVYILELLDEVVSHDLAGGKVTGNMMEDATCKDDSSKVTPGLHVFLVPSSVLTPTSDDLVVSIGGIGENFLEAVYPDYEKPEDDEEEDEDDPSAEMTVGDINANLVTGSQGDTLSLVEITELAAELTTEAYNEVIESMETFAVSTQMNDMTSMYQTLSYEMDQMNVYFSSIYSILLSFYEGDSAPLPAIQSKEYKDG